MGHVLMQERLLVCSEYFEHGPVLLLVERIEQVKGVFHVKQERKELLSLSGTSVGIKQAKLTKLASVRILTLVILEYMF
jgi:hypothetical protein